MPLDPAQFHNRNPDRVGAAGGPGGEDSPGNLVQEGDRLQARFSPALGVVQLIDQDYPFETLQIFQPRRQVLQEFGPAPGLAGPDGLDGHTLGILPRGADYSDRLEGDGWQQGFPRIFSR